MKEVVRPKAGERKIHSKNEFELCYLRHQYLRRSTANPTAEEIRPYNVIIRHLARNTYTVYTNLFRTVGFDLDDIINIGQVHLVSYLGLFSLEKTAKKYDEFVRVIERVHNRIPTDREFLEKNKANFTLFLKQRMQELVRISRQKAKNIKGYPTEEFSVYCGAKRPPRILRNLLEHSQDYGYRKLDMAVFKSIRKRAKVPYDSKAFRFSGIWYVCVPISRGTMTMDDFTGADLDPYDNAHNHNPEQVYFDSLEEKRWKVKKKQFERQPAKDKARQIRAFIAKYEEKPAYSDEIRAARKMLAKLEI